MMAAASFGGFLKLKTIIALNQLFRVLNQLLRVQEFGA